MGASQGSMGVPGVCLDDALRRAWGFHQVCAWMAMRRSADDFTLTGEIKVWGWVGAAATQVRSKGFLFCPLLLCMILQRPTSNSGTLLMTPRA